MILDKRKVAIAMAQNVLTTNELSSKAGIHIVTLNRALNDRQKPTPATIGKIARALNVPVESIIRED